MSVKRAAILALHGEITLITTQRRKMMGELTRLTAELHDTKRPPTPEQKLRLRKAIRQMREQIEELRDHNRAILDRINDLRGRKDQGPQ